MSPELTALFSATHGSGALGNDLGLRSWPRCFGGRANDFGEELRVNRDLTATRLFGKDLRDHLLDNDLYYLFALRRPAGLV